MWGLIKINSTQKIQYEQGYWKDRILHPREFHHPITFMPLELRYGLSFTGGAGGYGQNMPTNWIKYDENFGGSHYNAGKKIAKFGHQLDIDMPITTATHAVLFEGASPRKVVNDLMVRTLQPENKLQPT